MFQGFPPQQYDTMYPMQQQIYTMFPVFEKMKHYYSTPTFQKLLFDHLRYIEYRNQPIKGPYPGISHQKHDKLDINGQREFLSYLNQVASYYHKQVPAFQKAMFDFLAGSPETILTNEESELIAPYIYEQYCIELNKEEEKPVEQTQVQVQTPPPNEPPKKERKKLSKVAKAFSNEKPIVPKFPIAPKTVDEIEFRILYKEFVNYYNPKELNEFLKFPTPEEDARKKKEMERKQKEEDDRRRAIEKRMNAEARQKQLLNNQEEPNRLANLKEETVNVENLEVDTTVFIDPDESRQPINVVFIGHVDAGKSTLCGRILVDSGEIDPEEVRKFEQEAKDNSRESWWLAYCMDINEEERQKGKTVECGKAQFKTLSKRFTIFDAPGHKNYVPNMIMGACQADLAGLIISAKTGEFESGFEKCGQTQEHALLVKSLNVEHLIVIITKMDTINWDKERFELISTTIKKFLQEQCQFKQIYVIPIDALSGENTSQPINKTKVPWYDGPHLLKLLDEIKIPSPDPKGPIRIPVLDKLKDQGLFLFGKVEQGTIVDNLQVSLHPKKVPFQIVGIYNSKDQRMKYAKAGENVKIRVKGIEEEEIQRGYMICNLQTNHCPSTTEIQVKIHLLELPEHKRIMSQGYTCVLHLHCLVEEVEVSGVEAVYDDKNSLIKQAFIKSNQEGIIKLLLKNTVCLEKADVLPSLGRFALRDEGRTIAFGEITKFKSAYPKKDQKEIQALQLIQNA